MRNAGLDGAQAGIKIARRNITNLRYTDDTSHMAESEEELKNLLIKMKEVSENAGLEHSKNEDHDIRSHHFVANKWRGKIETVTDFIFLGSKITAGTDCCHELKRCLLFGPTSCALHMVMYICQ